jgi:hypothetical protein
VSHRLCTFDYLVLELNRTSAALAMSPIRLGLAVTFCRVVQRWVGMSEL